MDQLSSPFFRRLWPKAILCFFVEKEQNTAFEWKRLEGLKDLVLKSRTTQLMAGLGWRLMVRLLIDLKACSAYTNIRKRYMEC